MLSPGHRVIRSGAGALCALGLAAAAVSGAGAATPALGRTAVIQRIAGKVTFARPGSSHFAKLSSSPTAIPLGTTIAAARGTVQITIASSSGAVSALFYSGQFAIKQAASGIATLTLNGPLASCPAGGTTGASGTTKATRTSTHKPQQRSLWGNGGAGHFQTKGNYAAATVLGTVWLTTDSCASTVVSVAEGSVSVNDLLTNGSQTLTSDQAETVASSGATALAPFSGPTTPPSFGHPVSISASSTSVKLGSRYSLTATGLASGPGTVDIYENVGGPCSTTLAAEQTNKIAFSFGSQSIAAAGAFSLNAPALAKHTGAKYYCAYLTNPAAYAQVVVHVS